MTAAKELCQQVMEFLNCNDFWAQSNCILMYLKSLFYKQYFFSECNSDQLPIFFTHFWVGATAKQQQTHPKVSEKKWATGRRCIRKRSTTYKIGTLSSMSFTQLSGLAKNISTYKLFLAKTTVLKQVKLLIIVCNNKNLFSRDFLLFSL